MSVATQQPDEASGAAPVRRPSTAADVFRGFDTFQGLKFFNWLVPAPRTNLTWISAFAVPVLFSLFLSFVIPLVVAWATLESLTTNSESATGLAYFADWNTLFMTAVSTPVLMRLLATERARIPVILSRVVDEGTVRIDRLVAKRLRIRWEGRFRKVNVAALLIAVVVCIVVDIANYKTFTGAGYYAWQTTAGKINAAGYLFLIVQVPLLYSLCVIYFTRTIALSMLLRDLVRRSDIYLQPFHPDNAAGLGEIGNLGLRNQIVLATIGVNIVLLHFVAQSIAPDPNLRNLLIAAAIAYFIFGPIAFVAPLWPFRETMQIQKSDQLLQIGAAIATKRDEMLLAIEKGSLRWSDHQALRMLASLRKTVEATPVWPFDVETRRKFFGAYILPVVTFLATEFNETLIGKIVTALKLWPGE